jgi:methionyl-tRNA formyltransferase
VRILAFVAKHVGLRCVEFALDAFPEDELVVVAMDPGAEDTASALEARGVPVHRYSKAVVAALREGADYDWLLNLWGGHIFRPALLGRVRRSLNIHPSLLPIGRGRDPVVWAVRDAQPAGVTLHAITAGVDEGEIWYQEGVPYAPEERGGVVYERVVAACIRVFQEQWSTIRSGTVATRPQGAGAPARRRSELWADRTLDADADPAIRRTVRTLLAHDFGAGYRAVVTLGGRRYTATLELTPEE